MAFFFSSKGRISEERKSDLRQMRDTDDESNRRLRCSPHFICLSTIFRYERGTNDSSLTQARILPVIGKQRMTKCLTTAMFLERCVRDMKCVCCEMHQKYRCSKAHIKKDAPSHLHREISLDTPSIE